VGNSLVGSLPSIISATSSHAEEKFLEFFFATIRNKNTREAYVRAVMQFLDYMQVNNIENLNQIRPLMVASYIEQHPSSKQTVKQHLAAIRMLFDYLVVTQVIENNPVSSVKGPKMTYTRGKTPGLNAEEARKLLDSINISTSTPGITIDDGSAVIGDIESDYKRWLKSYMRHLKYKDASKNTMEVYTRILHKLLVFIENQSLALMLQDMKKEFL